MCCVFDVVVGAVADIPNDRVGVIKKAGGEEQQQRVLHLPLREAAPEGGLLLRHAGADGTPEHGEDQLALHAGERGPGAARLRRPRVRRTNF